MTKRQKQLHIPISAQEVLIQGARDVRPVSGLTHKFYRYPARFSPEFVRAAINTFTEPGDYVLDPYAGGGTSLVEAAALGRNAVGIDISQLAEFISRVKTTVLSPGELETLAKWASRVPENINAHAPAASNKNYLDRGYYRNLHAPERWRIRKAIDQALAQTKKLEKAKLANFARCIVLRTSQWALDGRRTPPTITKFREAFSENAADMLKAAAEFGCITRSHSKIPTIKILNRSAEGIENDKRLASIPAPRLIVTSPPYPGIHVLYHRWQVDGGKEVPLPFMIANKLDGAGDQYYTMGGRKDRELKTYFSNIKSTMQSVATVADKKSIVMQMVAFSNVKWQLPLFLEKMEDAGLTEVFLPALSTEGDGRLWRSVPNRRWYSDQRGKTPGSFEVVLFHRKT